MTEVTNQLQYLDLRRQLRQDYFNFGMKEGRWGVRVPKLYAKQHSTCHAYSFPQHTIEQYLQIMQSELGRTIQQLQPQLVQLQQYTQE